MRKKICILCEKVGCDENRHPEAKLYAIYLPGGAVVLSKKGEKKLGADYIAKLRNLSTSGVLQK